MRRPYWSTVAVFTILLAICNTGGRQNKAHGQAPQGQADSTSECDEAPYSEVTSATVERLPEMMAGTDDTAALAAAWMRVLTDVQAASEPESVLRDRMNWMTGFFEGRLRTQLPDWWAKSLVAATIGPDGEQVHIGMVGGRWFDHLPTGYFVPLGASIDERDDGAFLTLGEDTVRLPSEPIQQLRDENFRPHLSLCLADDRWYLAVYSPRAVPYQLLCLDRESGRALWSAKVCFEDRRTLGSSGAQRHRVTVVEENGLVSVYGNGRGIAYVEVFRAEDGHALVRFSTTGSMLGLFLEELLQGLDLPGVQP